VYADKSHAALLLFFFSYIHGYHLHQPFNFGPSFHGSGSGIFLLTKLTPHTIYINFLFFSFLFFFIEISRLGQMVGI
jgi:hypothetical protein